MGFLAPALLAGVALVAAPILVHLMTRRQAVRRPFPALRLLRARQQRRQTRLRVRRWLLLALRSLAVALLAIALARPILLPPTPPGAEVGGAAGPDGAALAVAIVVDNGPAAAALAGARSRLDRALEEAGWLAERLPHDARVAVVDRARGGRALFGEPASAAVRLGRLRPEPAARPLVAAAIDALAALAQQPAARRELCVFTDLARGSWPEDAADDLAAALARTPGVALRLIDTAGSAAKDTRNVGVVSARPTTESVVDGTPLRLRVTLAATGPWPEGLAAQLWIDSPDGPIKRDERPVTPPGDSPAPDAASGGDAATREVSFDFTLRGLPTGRHTGSVRLTTSDSLPDDDQRAFAVAVRRPPEVALVVARDASDEGSRRSGGEVFLWQALAPPGLPPRLSLRLWDAADLGQGGAAERLTARDAPAAVWLLDPPALDEQAWRALADYASSGAGVGFALGRRTTLDSVNSPAAQAMLPSTLRWRSREETYLRPVDATHPALRPLADFAASIPWAAFPVLQRWETAELLPGGVVVAPYADGKPAILARRCGAGRVLLVTTPLSDRLDRPEPWNLLPTGEDPWPFLLLAEALSDYLASSDGATMNVLAGEPVVVPLPPGFDEPGYVLRIPGGESVRQTIPPGQRELSVPLAEAPGAYRVLAGGASDPDADDPLEGGLDWAFAVGLDPAASLLERVDGAALAETISAAAGPGRATLLASRRELAEAVALGRGGRELYGGALALVAAAIAAELWVANRFYREAPAPVP